MPPSTRLHNDYDLVVIGGGSAGLTIGEYGARMGARVAIVEAERLGGDCTWTGCVPSKALLAAAKAAHTMRHADRFGLPSTNPQVELARVMARIRAAQEHIYHEHDNPDHLRALGCDVVHGRGRFIAPDTLEVEGERIYARFFCIATGSHSATPSIEGLDSVPYHTSETIFDLRELPQRLLVVGGGYIGTELAQAFARLGSSVTIAEEQPHLLPGQDPELTDLLAYSLRDEGLAVHTNTKVVQVSQRREIYAATLQTGDHEQDLEWDTLLVATGRRPNVAGLGLEVAGVAYDVEKGVHVDTALRTTNPRIYACGDVNGHYPFTQGAAYEAFLVLRNALFPFHSKTDYTLSPWSTFTDPGLARVGLTEAEARERYGNRINVYRYPFADADRAVVEQTTRGMVKLICAPWSGRIVGAHILGPAADELIHEWILAMKHGISASALAGTLHVYPTLSLASRSAAQQPLDALLRSSFSKAALRGYFTLARAVHTRIRPLLSSAKP